jgi:hypothetical protein
MVSRIVVIDEVILAKRGLDIFELVSKCSFSSTSTNRNSQSTSSSSADAIDSIASMATRTSTRASVASVAASGTISSSSVSTAGAKGKGAPPARLMLDGWAQGSCLEILWISSHFDMLHAYERIHFKLSLINLPR